MSYIGLLNESHLTTYTNVSASDDLTVGTSLRNLGSLTQIGAATFSGSLIGLLTTVSNGADLSFTYTPTTKTFNIQINNGSITNSKLSNSSIVIDGQLMTLGASYTTQLSTITNAMLAGSIALSKLAPGILGQIIIVNALGNAVYGSLTLNNLPYGTANQFLQTSGSNNAWITLSGDASLSSGILTIGNAAITNAKLLNSSISLNGQVMSLGTTAYTLTTSNITQGTNYYLNALTTTSPNEITLTLSSNNLTGSLINNTIDISKIKTAQIDSANTLSTLIKRDGTTGGFNAGLVQLLTGNWQTDTPSLILGQNNGLNQGVIQMWGNTTTSLFLEASTVGALQLYQKVNNNVTTLIFDLNPTVSSFNSNVNITSGHTYTIDNAEYLTTKTTNDLIEGTTNKYYSSVLAQADAKTAISSTDSTEIDFTYSAGNITASLKNNTIDISRLKTTQIDTANTVNTLIKRDASGNFSAGTITCSNGSSVAGVQYSAMFGQASSTKSGQIALIDGTSSNQYAQLYCRSNVFGIQGNITSIALTKNTSITGTLDAFYNSGSSGGSNITTPSSSTVSISAGLTSLNDGVMRLYSNTGAITTAGSIIQQNAGNLYIDNTKSTANTINIGTIGTSQTTNIKNANITNAITYSGGLFHNWSKVSYNAFQHTTGIPITIWAILYSGTNILQTSITARTTGSAIKVTVNIPLSNWGATAQNKHLSIARYAGSPWVVGQNTTGDIIGLTSVYGIHHILSGTTYDSVSFTYIDALLITAGMTYYYGVCARANTTAMASAGIGNNAYADISCEELF